MRRATIFMAAAVLAGLFTTTALATDPHGRHSHDARASIHTVDHPGIYGRPGSYHDPRYGRPGGRPGYHHGGRPIVVYPPYPWYGYPPVAVPPPYYGRPHICGPGCGPRCPHNSLYYRGNGWGFSFSF